MNELRAKARPTECGKVGCRAACPQAAADVCGNEKPCGLCCRGRRPRRPAEGSRPLPTMQRIRGGNGEAAGRACPAPTDCRKRVADERGEGGRQPGPFSRAEVAREWAAAHSPSESPSPLTRPAPFDKGASTSPLRGFGGAWRRTTSAASLLRKHARAVVCPAGANIARSPVSLRSTVAPRSQPRNTRI